MNRMLHFSKDLHPFEFLQEQLLTLLEKLSSIKENKRQDELEKTIIYTIRVWQRQRRKNIKTG
jgi:hypothetical protein